MSNFKVKVGLGAFYTAELLDGEGKPVTTLEKAVKVAEEIHPDWREVYNGKVGISREEVRQDPHWLFRIAEMLGHNNLDGLYDALPMFAVIEHFNGFSVRHLPSGEEHWLSDGVDCVFDEEGEPICPGEPDFTAEWSESMNSPASETLEAYFPQFMEEVMNCVLVIDCKVATDPQFEQIKAFSDDKVGNAAAENLFREWVQAASPEPISKEDMDTLLDNGLYEVGEGYIAITHTT